MKLCCFTCMLILQFSNLSSKFVIVENIEADLMSLQPYTHPEFDGYLRTKGEPSLLGCHILSMEYGVLRLEVAYVSYYQSITL